MAGVREPICESARTIFIDEGVQGISMRRVAADVGVTPTAIYRNFADKDTMITALVDEATSAGLPGFPGGQRVIIQVGRPREQLQRPTGKT